MKALPSLFAFCFATSRTASRTSSSLSPRALKKVTTSSSLLLAILALALPVLSAQAFRRRQRTSYRVSPLVGSAPTPSLPTGRYFWFVAHELYPVLLGSRQDTATFCMLLLCACWSRGGAEVADISKISSWKTERDICIKIFRFVRFQMNRAWRGLRLASARQASEGPRVA